MPDYQLGKIYKITSGDLIYIGSTTSLTLARRLAEHRSDYKRWKENTKKGKMTSFNLIEEGNYEITLIELYPCNSRDELVARERFHIENTNCINKNIPLRKTKEYYQDHKEEQNKRTREYYQDHKEERKLYNEEHKEIINEKRREYYQDHKQLLLEKRKLYREANRDKINKLKKDAYYQAKKSLV